MQKAGFSIAKRAPVKNEGAGRLLKWDGFFHAAQNCILSKPPEAGVGTPHSGPFLTCCGS